MTRPDDGPATEALAGVPASSVVRGFVVEVIEGANAGRSWQGGPRCAIGSAPGGALVLDDPAVSRFHCELIATPTGVRVRDLDSKNGTSVDGVVVQEALVRAGSSIRCGRSVLRVAPIDATIRVPLSSADRFGGLVGGSIAMRAVFAVLERAAATDVTVLLEGETGTGKEGAARALHLAGARRAAPFLVFDCSAVAPSLIEAMLFGHERGAFTGADQRHPGVFEAAAGGTVLLDEIGELPLDLQPKLLRILEAREVRPLGATAPLAVDVRVIAATHRDLRAEVNAGTFRADLYYRVAVVRAELPPLRQRPDDLPALVATFTAELVATGRMSPAIAAELAAPDAAARLAASSWPGNVRELRNHLERCAVMGAVLAPEGAGAREPTPVLVDVGVPFKDARKTVLDHFERSYLTALLARHDGNVAAAARHAGLSRASLYELLHRHGLR